MQESTIKYLKWAGIAFGVYLGYKWFASKKALAAENGNGARNGNGTGVSIPVQPGACPPGTIISSVTGQCVPEEALTQKEKDALELARNPPPYEPPAEAAPVPKVFFKQGAVPPFVISAMKEWRVMNNKRAKAGLKMIQMPPIQDFIDGRTWEAFTRYGSEVGMVPS